MVIRLYVLIVNICEKEQLENVIVRTEQFLNSHSQNYSNIIKNIICKKPLDTFILKEFNQCTFNTYFEFLKRISSNSDYSFLEKSHKKFHISLNKILECYFKNENISEELFDNLYLNRIKLIENLRNIVSEFDFAKNQIDSLTKAWKRDFFVGLLENEFSKFKRGEKTFCLVYFDIDFFKNINDLHSHYVGDVILKDIVMLIKDSLREYDSISRWGGDEFLILLPYTNLSEAFLIISRVKKEINNKIFHIESKDLKLTCSFGIVESNINITINNLINKADKLLYKAKKLGRNRIEI